jgi:hypothetical protein
MTIDELPPGLKPYENDLFRAVFDGLSDYDEQYGARRADQSKRSQRSLCHDSIKKRAVALFPVTSTRHQLFLVHIDEMRIKVKMLDQGLHPRNNTTQMVLDFMRQSVSKLFDSMETVNLVLGYQPHPFDIRQSKIWLTYPNGTRDFHWVYELRREQASTDTITVTIINPPNPPSPRRVRPKAAPAAKGSVPQ